MPDKKDAKKVLKKALKKARSKKTEKTPSMKKVRKYMKSDKFVGPRDPRSMKIKKKNLPPEMGGKQKFQKVPEIDAVNE